VYDGRFFVGKGMNIANSGLKIGYENWPLSSPLTSVAFRRNKGQAYNGAFRTKIAGICLSFASVTGIPILFPAAIGAWIKGRPDGGNCACAALSALGVGMGIK
jgi:hypothetical protein